MKALLLAAALAPSAQPKQFDLICSGTVHSIRVTLTEQEPDSAYSYHYRVDLGAGRWCDGKCVITRPIAEVQPNILRLDEQTNVDGPTNFEKQTSSIDRVTGEHRIMSEQRDPLLGHSVTTWHGACAPAPFSGFPAPPRKF